MQIKFKHMQKHPSIRLSSTKGSCSFSKQVLSQPIQLSPYAFSRHLKRSALHCSYKGLGFKVYALPCGCFVWVHYSGYRQLSALPF
jgi:hypothetical protein